MKDFEKVAAVIPAPERPQDEIRFRDFHIRAMEIPEMAEVEVKDKDGEVIGVKEKPTGVMLTEIQCVELTLIACKKGDESVVEIAVPLCLKGDNAKAFLAPFMSELKIAINDWMVSRDTDG